MDCCGERDISKAQAEQSATHNGSRSLTRISVIGLTVLAVLYAVLEHRTHLLGALPYIILLACPLMHLFMHHGHRQAPGDRNARPSTPSADAADRRR
jgi:hypothetical protein